MMLLGMIFFLKNFIKSCFLVVIWYLISDINCFDNLFYNFFNLVYKKEILFMIIWYLIDIKRNGDIS